MIERLGRFGRELRRRRGEGSDDAERGGNIAGVVGGEDRSKVWQDELWIAIDELLLFAINVFILRF